MTEQASQRSANLQEKLRAVEASVPELEEHLADWKSRAEVAEKILAQRQQAAQAKADLLELEEKTLRDKRNALVKQLRNESLKAEKSRAEVAAAEEAFRKVDMRRQVVQGQLDMVTRINAKAEAEGGSAKIAPSRRKATAPVRKGPFLPGMKDPAASAGAAEELEEQGEDDWGDKIENLMSRFSIPRDLAVATLHRTQGHGGKAVMELGLDVTRNSEEAEIRDLFNLIDEDGSGTLEASEIQGLAKELGKPMTDVEVQDAMEEMDADGSGEVDWEEFLFWWQDQRTRPGGGRFKFASVLNEQMTLHRGANDRRAQRRKKKGLAERAAEQAQATNAMRAR